MKNVFIKDTQIFELIKQEEQRQQGTINLIASENYCPKEVREASASVLTNKYAEGYPGKRYYAGCEIIDQVETLAIERCKKLFNAEHANVQPHAGSQANMAAYFALINEGDTIMGMSLAEGGHLTHGHNVSFSGKLYKSIQYKVNKETGLLDYEEIEKLAKEHKPKLIICGASAYSRTIDFEKFSKIAKSVGALLMADIAHIAGLIVAGQHPNPFPHADIVTSTTHKTLRGPRGGLIMCKKEFTENIDKAIIPGLQGGPFENIIAAKAVCFFLASQPEFIEYQKQVIVNAKTMVTEFEKLNYNIVSGGTDNHLFILDLRNKKITGKTAQTALAHAGITTSRSCIPFDPEKPWITSGVRLGTPAITTRGFKEQDCIKVVHMIDQVLMNTDNETVLNKIKSEIEKLVSNFSLDI
ncbi:MAG: Serine hydroxymethyltransferase [candidate division TM6 bacterium GW2011_GWF2_32_72]|nr:MAG: Serine hydroxymethyltransferase [candidate division TM6 bacterium GW2011_GWF2_32_72]